MIVLDASAALEWLRRSETGGAVAAIIGDTGISLHAPHLLMIEVAQGLRRLVARDALATERAENALTALRDLDLTRHAHEGLLPRIWELRANLTAYDAAYVALAEVLDAPLVTMDARLAAAPGHRARVEVLG